ncbi:MAG: amidase family protein [Firmicutes bacterium]|nr:amidase family protein [Bacillota bacterium]
MANKLLTISDLQSKLLAKEFTCVEYTTQLFKHIENTAHLNNFISLTKDKALKVARQIDNTISNVDVNVKKLGNLFGAVVSIKDNIFTSFCKTTGASKLFENFTPPKDAEIVSRLLSCGAIIVGKANLDELGIGITNETSYYGSVKNVLDTGLVAGGSSGGSANAVAALQCNVSIATDTGGSIRLPSSFTNTIGFKPSSKDMPYSRGVHHYVKSLDQIGFLSSNIDDLIKVYNSVSQTSSASQTKGGKNQKTNTPSNKLSKKIVIGIDISHYNFITKGREQKVAILNRSLQTLKALATLGGSADTDTADFVQLDFVDIKLDIQPTLEIYDILGNTEFYETFALDTALDESKLGAEARARYNRGKAYSKDKAMQLNAQTLLANLKLQADAAFKKCDIIFTPTTPFYPIRLGALSKDKESDNGKENKNDKENDKGEYDKGNEKDKGKDNGKGVRGQQYKYADIYSMFANLLDLPSISLPSFKKLPTGQLPFNFTLTGSSSEMLLRISKNYLKSLNSQ